MHQRLSLAYLVQTPLVWGAPVIMLLLVSCSPKARLVGEVRDGFGKPLSDVEVSIPSTAFKSTTGSNGKYAVPFAPGKFSVSFVKNGYSSYSLSQEVSVETTVPLAMVTLYKRPPEQGVWFLGSDNYIQIRQGKLITTGGDRSHFAWAYQMTYRVGPDFTQLSTQNLYRFLDNSPEPLALFKLSEQGILATRAESFAGMGDTHGTVIKENNKVVADGMTLREAPIGPGRYAYVKVSQEFFAGRISAPVFPFEIR
jgi:hypothetical protein